MSDELKQQKSTSKTLDERSPIGRTLTVGCFTPDHRLWASNSMRTADPLSLWATRFAALQ